MNNHKQPQQGTVLVTGLILITAISLVSVVTMENAVVQDRLATNTQLNVTAFQEAEAALVRVAVPSHMVESMDATDSTVNLHYKNGVENSAPGEYKNKFELIRKYTGRANFRFLGRDESSTGTGANTNTNTNTNESGTNFAINSSIEYCGILAGKNTRGISLNANQAANSDKNYVRHVFDITANIKQTGGKKSQSQHAQRSSRLMLSTVGKVCT